MVRFSIVSLIYRSRRLADWVYDSVHEFTPKIGRGEAEFFFVANDPTDEVVEHLVRRGYPHCVHRNPPRTNAELFQLGYGRPEYMHRVYRAYNQAILAARGEVVVLVNSDNYFSPDWLEGLHKYLTPEVIVSSKLVERRHPRHDLFPGVYHGEFGSHPDDFDRHAFLRFVEQHKITGIEQGGAYMPCMFYKEVAVRVGLYPEGNIAGRSFDEVATYGDVMFFRKLDNAGVRHITALDSIVYHTKEGEMDDGAVVVDALKGRQEGPAEASEPFLSAPRLARIAVMRQGQAEYLTYGKLEIGQPVVSTAKSLLLKGLRRVLPGVVFQFILSSWLSLRNMWSRDSQH